MMTIRAAALLLAIATPVYAQSGNLVQNGTFSAWSHGNPVHTVSGAWGPDGWWIGPGKGGTVTIWPAPQDATRSMLAIRWDVVPLACPTPVNPYTPDTCTSDIETHLWNMTTPLMGKQVTLRFHAWVSQGTAFQIIPVIWIDWTSDTDQWVYVCPPVTVPADRMIDVVCSVTLPATGAPGYSTYVGAGSWFQPISTGTTLVLSDFVLTTP